jgi:hypothetical protein
MSSESKRPPSQPTSPSVDEAPHPPGSTDVRERESDSDLRGQRSKLSVNVSREISERLRNLAYTNRLSESSIVEVALTAFFARGDDALLGALLKQLGASLRRKK